MSITIIFAPPRAGKTALMTKFLSDEMFNYERIKACRSEIARLNLSGFNYIYPDYVVASNYNIEAHKFGYTPRRAMRINPYRLGFVNNNVYTHFLPPFCCVGIMEAQKYFNSRLFKKYPAWQSRFYEMHGHNHYDFYFDTQRPNLIDVNIRELSTFIDIQNMIVKGNIIKWDIRRISSSFELDKYFESGKRDYYTTDIIIGNRCVLDFYDTRENKPLFYNNHFDDNFDTLQDKFCLSNVDDYKYFCENFSDEIPDKFYV
ncbi:MAG: hypothetical protein ACI4M6_01330 [Christensenellaceae bacterium]